MIRSLLWAAFALLAAISSPAFAEERITRFVSDVQVQPDSSLLVTETIDVVAENVRISHGIFRDFPTRYKSRLGNQLRVGFELLNVHRNGQPEKSATEPVAGGIRIKIGDPDVVIPPGEYRYTIRYRTTRQIGRFDKFDELYWNATGNGWTFPIDAAQARIRLPKAVPFGQRAFYTGSQGAAGSDAKIVAEKPGDITVQTTRPLGPGEGLTIAVSFPKGVVAEASDSEKAAWWLADYGPPAVGILGLLGLVAFYYIAWARAGRDPRAGTVVPIFAPADGLTPAAMRYIVKMGTDNRAFAAALVDLGVRGHVRLSEEDGGWFASDKNRIERIGSANPIPDEEEDMLRELVSTGESSVMERKNHAKFSAARKSLDAALKRRFEGSMFKRNTGWSIAGVGMFIAALWLAAAAVIAASGLSQLKLVLIPLGSLLVGTLLAFALHGSTSTGKCLLSIAMFVAFAAAIATGFPIIPMAFASGWYMPMAIPALALPLVISAFFWIAAPTREGRAVLDRIAGFKQYLSIAEGPRLDRMTGAPAPTVELFEKYLPFAIALGVENKWADKFHDVLAQAQVEGRQSFGWYSGSSSPWSNPSGFVSTVGSGLASTISSASTAPGGRSGSGGGGFSGGGGGGGGGGGW